MHGHLWYGANVLKHLDCLHTQLYLGSLCLMMNKCWPSLLSGTLQFQLHLCSSKCTRLWDSGPEHLPCWLS
jgi:hypothetical protein